MALLNLRLILFLSSVRLPFAKELYTYYQAYKYCADQDSYLPTCTPESINRVKEDDHWNGIAVSFWCTWNKMNNLGTYLSVDGAYELLEDTNGKPKGSWRPGEPKDTRGKCVIFEHTGLISAHCYSELHHAICIQDESAGCLDDSMCKCNEGWGFVKEEDYLCKIKNLKATSIEEARRMCASLSNTFQLPLCTDGEIEKLIDELAIKEERRERFYYCQWSGTYDSDAKQMIFRDSQSNESPFSRLEIVDDERMFHVNWSDMTCIVLDLLKKMEYPVDEYSHVFSSSCNHVAMGVFCIDYTRFNRSNISIAYPINTKYPMEGFYWLTGLLIAIIRLADQSIQ